jgi:hypothetical protein
LGHRAKANVSVGDRARCERGLGTIVHERGLETIVHERGRSSVRRTHIRD